MKKEKTIKVPYHLCKLLVSKKKDFKDPKKYDLIQDTAKALLKVLMEL